MRTAHRYLYRPAEGMLALDLGKISESVRGGGGTGAGAGQGWVERAERLFATQKTKGFVEGGDPVDGDAFDEGGFFGREHGQENAAFAEGAGQAGHHEGAAHRTGRAGKAQLAGDQEIFELGCDELLCGAQNAECDRQVVNRPSLRRWPGARLIVVRVRGGRKPLLPSAEKTRSSDSLTAASGRPTR